MKTRTIITYTLCALIALLSIALAFVFGTSLPRANAEAALQAESSEVYEAKDFTELPEDWEQIAASDTAHTRTTFFDGEAAIYHSATSGIAANYYGSAYRIAVDREYGDFAFEMTFRMVSWENESRFIAVMFHTKQTDGRLIGYMANYRINGQNAVSALNKTAAYDKNNKTAAALGDKALHTLKITLEGTTANYYIDDSAIEIAESERPTGGTKYEWDISKQDVNLGGAIERGGFALLVNRSQIQISSVRIAPTATPPAPPPEPIPEGPVIDETIASTYFTDCGIINAPTVVCDATDKATLDDALTSKAPPSNIILRYGDDGNVIGRGGESLGAFSDVYLKIRGKIVPVVRVETEGAADAFVDYLKTERSILDISVLSSDPALVKRVRKQVSSIRGMILFDEIGELSQTVATLQSNYATVAVLPQRIATTENVTYIQARFKTVWAMPDSYLSRDVYDCINSGAYGIVTPYFADVYDLFKTYADGTLIRTPMNAAHRGCSNLSYENSLSAVRLAIENGATHLELDGKLTTDGHIIIIHDDDISSTTTCDTYTNAESLSLAELQSYDLQLRAGGGQSKRYLTNEDGDNIIEHLPSLEEVLDLIKDTEVVLVFEIKTSTLGILDVLKSVVDEYGMRDRVIAISFDDSGSMIERVNAKMPYMPIAWLEGLGNNIKHLEDFADILKTLGKYNSAYDKNYNSGVNSAFNRYLRDRGMVGWYWTFADETAVNGGERLGYLGLTNNCAEVFNDRVRFVFGKAQSKATLAAGDTVKIEVVDYAGDRTEQDAEVFWCRKTADGWAAIAKYVTADGYTMYTQSFEITKSNG